MCGITGAIWSDQSKAIPPDVLKRMTDVLSHRGPDDSGSYESQWRMQQPQGVMPGVGLGFRRLAIIDLAAGRQPLSNEDGTIWLVFNGEIYNYRDLRRRLEGAGHTFRTESDSETIVHLYEDEGVDCFRHLNGMFAIAIWDSVRRRLVLARDRLGQKPLVYHHEPGRVAFASELKSLREIPGISATIDPNAVDEYLTYQYVPHPNTIYREFRKLPPGHFAIFEDEKLTVKPYWEPNWNVETTLSHADAIERTRDLLTDAVRLRLRSDVPLGAFLSGGIDSSLLVALMAQELGQPVKTFSIGFSVAEYDETKFARQVAEHLGTEHHEFQVTPDAVEILPKLAWHYDEPFADSSAVPTWYVAQHTREHVTVAISGDGGDELFAGYPRYKATALAERCSRWGMQRMMASPLWQKLPSSGKRRGPIRRLKRFAAAMGLEPIRRYLDWVNIFDEQSRAELYSADFVNELDGSDPFRFLAALAAKSDQRDMVTTVSMADLQSYLPCDLLTKVDIATMAHSLECRQPFLDHRLVEWAATIPIKWKMRYGAGKKILRDTFGHLLPNDIWTRRKMGFGVPIDHWLRNELYEMTHDTLLSESAKQLNFFQPEMIERMLSEHRSGSRDHSYRLWALLMFELWRQRWM
jgi:asparagine synthase (glutamine-hydrolysing)